MSVPMDVDTDHNVVCCDDGENSWVPCGGNSLQDSIRAINRDKSLSQEEKLVRIQAVYNQSWQDPPSSGSLVSDDAAFLEDRTPTYRDAARTEHGCQHYARKCKLEAACCKRLFCCRFCHDEASHHNIDRYATENVWCMLCDTLQPVGESCVNCKVKFASYFCATCKFYDNDANKSIYHCDKCGMCRIGKGVGVDNVHCDKCNACVSVDAIQRHHCLERSLEVDCPICSGYLFTSTLPVVFMRCGHTMHTHCFEEYTKTNYTCPLCCKSLANMSSFYARLDDILSKEILPPEYANRSSNILCNDCGVRSKAAFHFMYHKCGRCKGYNTKVLQTSVSD
uniref:Uncharacterized protein n=1 Tax=Timspurckia oligopyrenoides TaxID=708627 RepID=A0A7S0ZKZ4_9RHOD|mmetsp:Transcript_920/g.1712  ORF Transcript_920/g.1712 Transcript_920/m.1712 type:complete len:337 (+) Transcript_920:704-1714(+)|eukprot:CAMPEP_0182446410 /NCGR_PEP_ID=MMETSP1172-20130603/4183_1 /TAXON_ID=708627 /ORGANISM="Timspurckia oligopyrenoides, Strain CCMP3278" /LENGTH=336 /DNA_ID=CAMNT_0024642339 /DNA_START=677 /DNA_END=1687 /DNA_ORIENTATION=-